VISNVVVTYSVKPEALEEHLRLIAGVFEQLRADARDDVDYQVLRLADGVSFVHVSSADTTDGSNPLPELAAFREFGADLASRVTAPPIASPADVVADYRR
jgi:hypothetical protein